MNSLARRMFELVEPIGVIPYSADEPNEAMFALGFTNYRDTYFAGRAAPLGLFLAARTSWRRAHRGLDDRGCWRPRGSRSLRPRRGHASGEVRTHPAPPGRAARRRDRRDARPRPDRGRRLAQRTRSRRQTTGRGAHRRPRSEALRKPRAGRPRRARGHARAARRAATRRPGLVDAAATVL